MGTGTSICACPLGYAGRFCNIGEPLSFLSCGAMVSGSLAAAWPHVPTVPTVPNELCTQGNGTEYRGVASTTASGLSCLAWNSDLLYQELHVDSVGAAALLGLGPHAYCRSASSGHSDSFCVGKGVDRVVPQTQQGPTLPRWPLTSASWEGGVKCAHQGLQSKHIALGWVWVPAPLGARVVV